MYAKLKDGVVSYAPMNYVLEDGRIITNFNKSEELMRLHGFKEVIDNQPTYDAETQYLSVGGYVENDTNITVNYTINDTIPEETETVEEKITRLQSELDELKASM